VTTLYGLADKNAKRSLRGFRDSATIYEQAVVKPVPSHGSELVLSRAKELALRLSEGREFHPKGENGAAENKKRRKKGGGM